MRCDLTSSRSRIVNLATPVSPLRSSTFSFSRSTIPYTTTHRGSAICDLDARYKVLPCSTVTAELRGDVWPTTGVCGAGVRPMKVLSENFLRRSLSLFNP